MCHTVDGDKLLGWMPGYESHSLGCFFWVAAYHWADSVFSDPPHLGVARLPRIQSNQGTGESLLQGLLTLRQTVQSPHFSTKDR